MEFSKKELKKLIRYPIFSQLYYIYHLYHRNRVVLGDDNPFRKKYVNLNGADWGCVPNVGDYLPKVVFDYMTNRGGVSPHSSKTYHLFTIGSIINFTDSDAVIWGSGILRPEIAMQLQRKHYIKLDVRAVRGPITRRLLLECGYKCPEIYGDPAILMPLIYKPQVTKYRKFGLIIHYNKLEKCDREKYEEAAISVATRDYKTFINEICGCEKVISSSLHGIILAESYGIPAIMIQNDVEDQPMKFFDYYYSTGRYHFKIASSIEEAIEMKPMELPELDDLRKGLLDSFPYDIFGKKDTGKGQ